jgi:hypothetical protein
MGSGRRDLSLSERLVEERVEEFGCQGRKGSGNDLDRSGQSRWEFGVWRKSYPLRRFRGSEVRVRDKKSSLLLYQVSIRVLHRVRLVVKGSGVKGSGY